jgi:predicted RNA-binding protein YlxR (DUF448 family)
VPIRTCVACRRRAEKSELLRWVVDSGGVARPDPAGTLPGRGSYVCRTEACWRALRRRFRRGGPDFEESEEAFRLAIPEDVIQNVRRESRNERNGE